MKVASGSHWTTRFYGLIQSIEPLGSYVHAERLTNVPQLLPYVKVDEVGRLGFPMLDMVVDKLIACSAKAPYGKLDQTLMDTNVRDAWQIDASKITIGGGDTWTSYFDQVVRQHCFQLGISSERFDSLGIQANLYKLLMYEKDGHFLTHRDTEKEPHMFGTMILQLPTSDGFQGGEFTVSHGSATKNIDLSVNSDNEFQTVSFYADCEHKLHPITDGKRVCLAYNLVATSPKIEEATLFPSHAVYIATENELRSICDEWNANDLQKISKIGYQLEHKYTHQSLGISTLKGRDEVVVTTLRNARNAKGIRLFHISILLMQHHFERDYLADEYTDKVQPYLVIEENADGVWVQKMCNGIHWSQTGDVKFHSVTASSDWDMVCYSKNGWWVMPDESIENVVKEHVNAVENNERAGTSSEKDEKGGKKKDEEDKHDEDIGKADNEDVDADRDEYGDDDEDDDEGEDNDMDDDEDEDDGEGYSENEGDLILWNRKMFTSTCDSRQKENGYNGNDGGSHETFYYAAAIIISPMEDVSNSLTVKKQKL